MASSWERLYSSTLGSTGTTIDTGVGGIAAKEYLRIIVEVVVDGSSENSPNLRFNGDTGTNYPIKRNTNGGSDSTITNRAYWYNGYGGTALNRYAVIGIINVADEEKAILHHQVMTTAGAGNAPVRIETVGKWVNTSAQITDIELSSGAFDGSGSFGIGTTMTVWGADDGTPFYPNLPNGTIFEQTNDYKYYMWDGTDTWNVVATT